MSNVTNGKRVKITYIMLRAQFWHGVNDYRAGKPFRKAYDMEWSKDGTAWHYERGRQFAAIAPRDMPLRSGRGLNPAAVRLFSSALTAGSIL